MDPIGFGLENFDWMGRWRDKDADGEPIDATGELPSGEKFNGPVELRQALLSTEGGFHPESRGQSARIRAGPQSAGWRQLHGTACRTGSRKGQLSRANADSRDRAERSLPQHAGRNRSRLSLRSPAGRSNISGLNALKQDAASHNNQVKTEKLTPKP